MNQDNVINEGNNDIINKLILLRVTMTGSIEMTNTNSNHNISLITVLDK